MAEGRRKVGFRGPGRGDEDNGSRHGGRGGQGQNRKGGRQGQKAGQQEQEGGVHGMTQDPYEYEEEVADEERGKNRRYDNMEVYEYELPEDFEDEEIDEDEAFTAEDKKRFGEAMADSQEEEEEEEEEEDDESAGDGEIDLKSDEESDEEVEKEEEDDEEEDEEEEEGESDEAGGEEDATEKEEEEEEEEEDGKDRAGQRKSARKKKRRPSGTSLSVRAEKTKKEQSDDSGDDTKSFQQDEEEEISAMEDLEEEEEEDEEDMMDDEDDEEDGDVDNDADVAERHRMMLEAVTGRVLAGKDGEKDGGKKRQQQTDSSRRKRTSTVVSEAFPESEFNVGVGVATAGVREGGGKVTVSELVGSLAGTQGFAALRKKMDALQRTAAPPVAVPLAKPIKERVERQVGYSKAKEEVSKWAPIIRKNRDAPTLVFNKVELPRVTTAHIATIKPKTAMEKEIAAVLEESGLADVKRLENAEELELNKLTVEEVRERKERLAKMRSLLFQHEAKARRMKKIKSKTYHRIKLKEEAKRAEKMKMAVEEMDPEAAREEEMKRERMRAEERLRLKHKNTSKWARRIIKRGLHAHNDDGTRDAIAEQLRMHQMLTRKIASSRKDEDSSDLEDSSDATSSEEEGGGGGGTEGGEAGAAAASSRARIKAAAKGRAMLLKDLEEGKLEDAPSTGLFALPFMKRAIEKRKKEAEEEAMALLKELESKIAAGRESAQDGAPDALMDDGEDDENAGPVRGRLAFGDMAEQANKANDKSRRRRRGEDDYDEEDDEGLIYNSDDDDDDRIRRRARLDDEGMSDEGDVAELGIERKDETNRQDIADGRARSNDGAGTSEGDTRTQQQQIGRAGGSAERIGGQFATRQGPTADVLTQGTHEGREGDKKKKKKKRGKNAKVLLASSELPDGDPVQRIGQSATTWGPTTAKQEKQEGREGEEEEEKKKKSKKKKKTKKGKNAEGVLGEGTELRGVVANTAAAAANTSGGSSAENTRNANARPPQMTRGSVKQGAGAANVDLAVMLVHSQAKVAVLSEKSDDHTAAAKGEDGGKKRKRKRKASKGKKEVDGHAVAEAIKVVAEEGSEGSEEGEGEEEDLDEGGGALGSQRDLIRRAFAGDDVQAEFDELKMQAVDEEVPLGEGPVHIPGWGQWTRVQERRGPPEWMLKEHEELLRKKEKALAMRKDAGKKHLFINERLDKKVMKFATQNVPYPYSSAEVFESRMQFPIGREYNANSAFRDMIRPKEIKTAGIIIDPIKYVKSENGGGAAAAKTKRPGDEKKKFSHRRKSGGGKRQKQG
ncbi:hypothetical protein CBR_g19437 [Chara braunii]|uniref:U3 small nucleolar RNA-associated protein 14 n=1 Tax=Chara braunii TaxID=69332 RepID=A0A388KYA3_CHABU|nr:hypothetical protein CBR_g19437 [Chara braunii]|eukprot:GBG74923.1 hypothetical protein CBR_g19437 [Chara braunii]